jgi:hypothetical protein
MEVVTELMAGLGKIPQTKKPKFRKRTKISAKNS